VQRDPVTPLPFLQDEAGLVHLEQGGGIHLVDHGRKRHRRLRITFPVGVDRTEDVGAEPSLGHGHRDDATATDIQIGRRIVRIVAEDTVGTEDVGSTHAG